MKINVLHLILLWAFFSGKNLIAQDTSTYIYNSHLNHISVGYDFKKLRKINQVEDFGAMHVKYERAFTRNLGLGVATYFAMDNGYVENTSLIYPNGEFVRYNYYEYGFAIIPKVNWHFDLSHAKNKVLKKFDIYLGAGIGYGFGRKRYDYLMKDEDIITYIGGEDHTDKNHFVASEINVGARFYPLEHFGAYFELGFGTSRGQLGLIYKW